MWWDDFAALRRLASLYTELAKEMVVIRTVHRFYALAYGEFLLFLACSTEVRA